MKSNKKTRLLKISCEKCGVVDMKLIYVEKRNNYSDLFVGFCLTCGAKIERVVTKGITPHEVKP